jgi:hypothetical protein
MHLKQKNAAGEIKSVEQEKLWVDPVGSIIMARLRGNASQQCLRNAKNEYWRWPEHASSKSLA